MFFFCPNLILTLPPFFNSKSDGWSWQCSLIVYENVESLSTQIACTVWKMDDLISVNVTVERLFATTSPVGLSVLFPFLFRPLPSPQRTAVSCSFFLSCKYKKKASLMCQSTTTVGCQVENPPFVSTRQLKFVFGNDFCQFLMFL